MSLYSFKEMIDLNALIKYTELSSENFLKNLATENSIYGLFNMSVIPDYENGIDIPNNEMFEIPEDGYVVVNCYNHSKPCTNLIVNVYSNDGTYLVSFLNRCFQNAGENKYSTVNFPIAKGFKIKVVYNSESLSSSMQTYFPDLKIQQKFFPFKKD